VIEPRGQKNKADVWLFNEHYGRGLDWLPLRREQLNAFSSYRPVAAESFYWETVGSC
jgi:hypothetical protein